MSLLFSVAVVLMSGPVGMWDEGAFDEVLRRSPVIRSSDPDVSALDVRIDVGNPAFSVSWRCLYRAPGDRMLLIRDETDGTPIAWSDGTTIAYYDPLGSRLVVTQTHGPTVEAFSNEEDSAIGMGTFTTREEYEAKVAEQGGEFWLDLRSLAEVDPADRGEVARGEDGSIRTSIVSRSGNAWEITIEEVGAATRWTTRPVHDPDGSSYALSVLVNGPAEDRLFERCRTPGPIEGLPAVEPGDVIGNDRGFLGTLGEMEGLMMRIALGRLAIRKPEAREELIPLLGDRELDWETLEEQDRLASERLREFWDVSGGEDEAP